MKKTTWFRECVLYNFQYFTRKLKEDEDVAWFSTSGFVSMAITFNISTVLFLIIGNGWISIKIENPGYVLIGAPWIIVFGLIFFNSNLNKYVKKNKTNLIKQEWKIYFWLYYITTAIIYAFAMSYYSQMT